MSTLKEFQNIIQQQHLQGVVDPAIILEKLLKKYLDQEHSLMGSMFFSHSAKKFCTRFVKVDKKAESKQSTKMNTFLKNTLSRWDDEAFSELVYEQTFENFKRKYIENGTEEIKANEFLVKQIDANESQLEKFNVGEFILELNDYEKNTKLEYDFYNLLKAFFSFYSKYADKLNPSILKNLNLVPVDGVFDVTTLIEVLKNCITSKNDRSLTAVGFLSIFLSDLDASQRAKILPQLLEFFKKYTKSYHQFPDSSLIVFYFKECAAYFSTDQLSYFFSELMGDDELIMQLSPYYSVSFWIKAMNDKDHLSYLAPPELIDYFSRLARLNLKPELDDSTWDSLIKFLLNNLIIYGDKLKNEMNEPDEHIVSGILILLEKIATHVPRKYLTEILKTLFLYAKKDIKNSKWFNFVIPFDGYISQINDPLRSDLLPDLIDMINSNIGDSVLKFLIEYKENISPSLVSSIVNKILECIEKDKLGSFATGSLRVDLLGKLVPLVSESDRTKVLEKINAHTRVTAEFFYKNGDLIVVWGRYALITPGHWNMFLTFLRESFQFLGNQAVFLHVMAYFMHDFPEQDRHKVIAAFIEGIKTGCLICGELPTYITNIIPFLNKDQLNAVTDQLITHLFNGTSDSSYIAPFLKVCREYLSQEKFTECLDKLINNLGQSKKEEVNFDIFISILAFDTFIPEQYWTILFIKISSIINKTEVSHDSKNSSFLMFSFRALEKSIDFIPNHQILNWSRMMINVLFEKDDPYFSDLAYSILLELAARASYPDRVAIISHVLSHSHLSSDIVNKNPQELFNDTSSFNREKFVLKLLFDINKLNEIEKEVPILDSAVKNIIYQYSDVGKANFIRLL